MTPFEVATGWITGEEADGPPAIVPCSPRGAPPTTIEAIEAVLLPALEQPPLVVAFSGGRDSSAVLAVAHRLAEREGLASPVAATLRYTSQPEVDEEEWQRRVVSHLRIDDWERIEADDSADLLGPVATSGLLRRGLVWPPAHHTVIPLLKAAAGGTLVMGDGGDEVFGDHRMARLVRLLDGQLPPDRFEWIRTVLDLAPRPIRKAVHFRALRADAARSWLLPSAQARFAAALAADRAAQPLSWSESVRRVRRMRALRLGFHNQDLVAAGEGTAVLRPLMDSTVLRALIRDAPRQGFADRGAAMRCVFSSLLPDAVLTRTTKARFNRVVFGSHSRAFVSEWEGDGLPEDLVDPTVLRRFWQAREPNAMTFALLQQAWLAKAGADRQRMDRMEPAQTAAALP